MSEGRNNTLLMVKSKKCFLISLYAVSGYTTAPVLMKQGHVFIYLL